MTYEYKPARHYKEGGSFPDQMQRDIQLKDGVLEGVVPRVILPGIIDESGEETLFLYYYQAGDPKARRVAIDEIAGMRTVQVLADPEFGNCLAVEFTYYKPKMEGNKLVQFKEETPRVVIPRRIGYGQHGLHGDIMEVKEFYIDGPDIKYLDMASRGRHFPFWRTGMYGDPEQQVNIYMPGKA